jgi:hypothetical protein
MSRVEKAHASKPAKSADRDLVLRPSRKADLASRTWKPSILRRMDGITTSLLNCNLYMYKSLKAHITMLAKRNPLRTAREPLT